jgi:predicted permease
MFSPGRWFRRLLALVGRRRREAEMEEEMRLHLEHRTRQNIAAGMAPVAARREAVLQFGHVEGIKERCREQAGFPWLEQLAGDLRLAGRMLKKSPGFAAMTIAILGLGIGASTALFTMVNALMLRPLAVTEPGDLVLPHVEGDPGFSYPVYRRLRDGAQSLSGLAASQNGTTRRALQGSGGVSESIQTQAVSGNFFPVLGVSAQLGRALSPEDDRVGMTATAVLGDAFWRRHFGGDRAVLGRLIEVDGVRLTVVGVMPPGFAGFEVGLRPDLWWPMHSLTETDPPRRNGSTRLTDEGWDWLHMVGRLEPGVDREQARAELRIIYERQPGRSPVRPLDLDRAKTGYTQVRRQLSQPLLVLSAAVTVVLLVACINLAGLLLVRGAARGRELAVRAALGAGRGRLARQLFTESLLLALMGGGLGLLLARSGTRFLSRYLPPRASAFDLQPDGRVLLFALAVSALTGVAFGLVPCLRGSRVDLATAMKDRGRHQRGRRWRLDHVLVVAQIAISMILLSGAGLFVRTLRNLHAVELGFHPESVVSFSLEFGRSYDAARRADVHRRLLQSLETLPGVRSATVAAGGLLSGEGLSTQLAVDGDTPGRTVRAQFVVVGPRFFETLGIPLLRGEELNTRRQALLAPGTLKEVVIGERMARQLFPGTDPLGRVMRRGADAPPMRIVAVAVDAKYRTPRENTPLEYYLPYFGGVMGFPMTVYLRSVAPPPMTDIAALVRAVDPAVTVTGLRTLEDVVDDTLVRERLLAQFATCFGVFTLLLASLGLYWVLSHGVVRRARELGVRVALGATVGDTVALVLRQGLTAALIGCALGMGAALAFTRLVQSFLYEVSPADPLTYAVTALLLLATAALACCLPARRAAKVDPMVAMRAE